MTHRGGVAADGLTGDGCGLLIRKPDAFLRALAAESGIDPGARFVAGLVFLPHDDALAAHCRATGRKLRAAMSWIGADGNVTAPRAPAPAPRQEAATA